MAAKLSHQTVEGVIWKLIQERQTPTMRRVSKTLDMSPSQLRRALRRDLTTNFRRLRARARVMYAVRAIQNGDKVEAALREVGLRNRTSFVKQCRRYAGGSPQDFRPRQLGDTRAPKTPRSASG